MPSSEMSGLTNAPEDWTTIDFRRWPKGGSTAQPELLQATSAGIRSTCPIGQHRPHAPSALLTWQCVTFTVVITRHTPDSGDPVEPLLAGFNAAVDEHTHDIATMIEGVGDVDWGLPTSGRRAARRLVTMWERGGAAAFRDLSAVLRH
jgi:hypothetical protein